jgi:hypothetical protein
MKRYFLGLALLMLSALAAPHVAAAQTPTGNLTVSWTAVTTNTNGSALLGAITTDLYGCQETTAGTPCTISLVSTPLAANLTGLTTTIPNLTTGITECVEAVVYENEGTTVGLIPSAPSNVICSAIPAAAVPNATTITVTVAITP